MDTLTDGIYAHLGLGVEDCCHAMWVPPQFPKSLLLKMFHLSLRSLTHRHSIYPLRLTDLG